MSFDLSMPINFSSASRTVYGIIQPKLTDVVWDGKTYLDIFSPENNCIPSTDVILSVASVIGTVSKNDCYTTAHGSPIKSTLYCSGNTSSQIKNYYHANGERYFIGAAAHCTRYVRGMIGVSIYQSGDSLYDGIYNVTDDFAATGFCFNAAKNFTWYFGTIRNADADAYIYQPIIINMDKTFGAHMPSDQQMRYLYTLYLKALTGNIFTIPMQTQIPVSCSYGAAFHAFLNALRHKAKNIGMNDTHITSPSGLDKGTTSSCTDMNRMFMVASGYSALARVWGKKIHKIQIGGPNARTEVIKSTINEPYFEQHYHILGGKTGTYPAGDNKYYYTLTVIAADKKGRIFCGCVMDATKRFTALKALFDKMVQATDDPNFDPYSTAIPETNCAVGWALPPISAANCEQYIPPIIYAQNADVVNMTASTIKTLTVITALDYISDIYETVTIHPLDIRGGSGNVFKVGDVVRVIDLLYAMMLPSSNTAATAIAHYVGEKIINKGVHL